MLHVDRIVNDILDSNCYIVHEKDSGRCFIVDPGSRNIDQIDRTIIDKRLIPDLIILTHSHFDHIAGVDALKLKYNPLIVASFLCSEKIKDPIKNQSYYTDLGSIKAMGADILVDEMPDGIMQWGFFKMFFFKTPGHTACSIGVNIDKMLFTGDTIIMGIPTRITYPDGSKDDLVRTLNIIYEKMPPDYKVFPGHGESFSLADQVLIASLNK